MRGDGQRIHGLVAGCMIDYPVAWAGSAQGQWRAGIVVLRNCDGKGDLIRSLFRFRHSRQAFNNLKQRAVAQRYPITNGAYTLLFPLSASEATR